MSITEQKPEGKNDGRPVWRKVTRETCDDKRAYDWMTRPRPEYFAKLLNRSRKLHKQELIDNPDKTIADLYPRLPLEMCERIEADVRGHWDEIEL